MPPRNQRQPVEVSPASNFTIQELTEIYNETRSDYVVPMPMSQAKMRGYINDYDVDLSKSIVAQGNGVALGLGMLGLRGDQAWITRLGVTPRGRRQGVGQAIMAALVENSRQIKAAAIILEVIKNNTAAHRMFERFGFEIIRDLLVIRRPPIEFQPIALPSGVMTAVSHDEALALLAKRSDRASWVTATESMRNSGNLAAFIVDAPGLGKGWLVYQNTPFLVSRLVLEIAPDASLDVARILLRQLHQTYPLQDTAVENLPTDDKLWPIFEELDYFVSFVRLEMGLDLNRVPQRAANALLQVNQVKAPEPVR